MAPIDLAHYQARGSPLPTAPRTCGTVQKLSACVPHDSLMLQGRGSGHHRRQSCAFEPGVGTRGRRGCWREQAAVFPQDQEEEGDAHVQLLPAECVMRAEEGFGGVEYGPGRMWMAVSMCHILGCQPAGRGMPSTELSVSVASSFWASESSGILSNRSRVSVARLP